MGRKYHLTTVDEYNFLKNKVYKIMMKGLNKGPIPFARARKQARKFIRQMKQIKEYHDQMGWPHPEANFDVARDIRQELELAKIGTKQPLANPDGSLYQKDRVSYETLSSKFVNPDGTLFEAPVLPGSILDPRYHSEDQIQRFLEESDASLLED